MKPSILYKSSKAVPSVKQKVDYPDQPLEKEYQTLLGRAVSNALTGTMKLRLIELVRLLGK